MAKFKVGDRVRCINNRNLNSINADNPKLVLGREYIVYQIHVCSKCGLLSLDVGLHNDGDTIVCDCLDKFNPQGIHYCNSSRFEKAIEKVEYIAVTTNIEIQEPALN